MESLLSTVIVGGLTVGGHAVGLIFHLKLKNGLLEMEKRLMAAVGEQYKRAETCEVEMKGVDHRLMALEPRRR